MQQIRERDDALALNTSVFGASGFVRILAFGLWI